MNAKTTRTAWVTATALAWLTCTTVPGPGQVINNRFETLAPGAAGYNATYVWNGYSNSRYDVAITAVPSGQQPYYRMQRAVFNRHGVGTFVFQGAFTQNGHQFEVRSGDARIVGKVDPSRQWISGTFYHTVKITSYWRPPRSISCPILSGIVRGLFPPRVNVRYETRSLDWGASLSSIPEPNLVIDHQTGLMWQAATDKIPRSRTQAASRARELRSGGYTDWRLPAIEELLSLKTNTPAGAKIFPVFDVVANGLCWSSSTNWVRQYAWPDDLAQPRLDDFYMYWELATQGFPAIGNPIMSSTIYVLNPADQTLRGPGQPVQNGVFSMDYGRGIPHFLVDSMLSGASGFQGQCFYVRSHTTGWTDSDGDGVYDPQDAFSADPAEWADRDHDGIGDNADPDDDNDDLPDDYELAQRLDPSDPSDAQADADGDGVSNLTEYRVGTDPHLAGSLNSAPELLSAIADQAALAGVEFRLEAWSVFEDPDTNDVLTLTAQRVGGTPALPSWLQFDSTHGVLLGTPAPADVGSFQVSLAATDQGGLSTSVVFRITVQYIPPELPRLSWATNAATVSEAAGKVDLWVRRDGPSTNSLSVTLVTLDLTTDYTNDYILPAETVTFAPGETTKPVTLSIARDGLYEPTETFQVRLATGSDAAITNPWIATVTVLDEDLPPRVVGQSPTSLATIQESWTYVTVAFSEPIQAFPPETITLSGTATAMKPEIGEPRLFYGQTWGFPISRLASGTLTVRLAETPGLVADFSGRALPLTEWSYQVSCRPGQPTGLVAQAVSTSEIRISWAASTPDSEDFLLERKRGETGAWTTLATVSGTITTYADINLAPGTHCTYRVSARNAAGTSYPSWDASATTLNPPEAPSNLATTFVPPDCVRVVWFDQATNEWGYTVERRDENRSDWELLMDMSSVGGGLVTYDDRTAPLGRFLFYRVRAWNNYGVSAYATNAVYTATNTAWVWRNPLPQGNDLSAVAYGNGAWVAAGGSGTLVTSTNGVAWSTRTLGSGGPLAGVAFGNNRFVVLEPSLAGNVMKVHTSSNGIHWASQDTSQNWSSVTALRWVEDRFFALSYGTMATSPDGVAWTPVHTGATWTDVAFGNGLYVAVASWGAMAVSSDAITWGAGPSLSNALSLAFGQGRFVAVGGTSGTGSIFSSTDGTNWTSAAVGSNPWRAVAYRDGRFIAVGDDGTAVSSDGQNWQSDSALWGLQAIASGPNCVTAVGRGGLIATSSDGLAWNAVTQRGERSLTSVIYGRNTFVAAGAGGPILISTYGSDWQPIDFAGSNRTVQAMAYGNGVFVLGTDWYLYHSTDGVTWTETNKTISCYGMTFGQGLFVAVGAGGRISTSPDGTNWQDRVSPAFSTLNAVTYGSNRFVAVGGLGNIVTSTNGMDWTRPSSPVATSLYAVACGNDRFIAVGPGGTVLTSADGLAWTKQNTASVLNEYGSTTPLDFTDISHDRGAFYALGSVGGSGWIATSSSGLNWNSGPSTSHYLKGIVWGNGVGVIVGDRETILSSGRPERLHNVIQVTATNGFVLKEPDQLDYEPGERVQLTAVPDVGYRFKGWTGAAQGTENPIQLVAEDKQVTAKFDLISQLGAATTNIPPLSRSFSSLSGVAYGNNLYVAVGRDYEILSSSNGMDWSPTRVSLCLLKGICYDGSRFVAVGSKSSRGVAVVSSDGLNWAQVEVGTSLLWSVASSADLLVAVGNGGAIFTSPDGLRWTAQTSGTSQNLYGVSAWKDGFVAVGGEFGSGCILSSPDGTNWTTCLSGWQGSLKAVTFGNERLVAVGWSGAILVSTNGQQWVSSGAGGGTWFEDVTFSRGRFLAAGGSELLTSLDGLTWTAVFEDHAYSPVYRGVIYGNNRFIAVGTTLEMSSMVSIPVGPTRHTLRVNATHGVVHCSPEKSEYQEGEAVQLRAEPAPGYVFAGWGGALSGVTRVSSLSGMATVQVFGEMEVSARFSPAHEPLVWETLRPTPTAQRLNAVVCSSNACIAVGDAGTILGSANARDFSPASSPTRESLFGLATDGESYVAVGANGTIVAAKPGLYWTAMNSGVTEDLTGVAWGANRWVAISKDGAVIISSNGLDWTGTATLDRTNVVPGVSIDLMRFTGLTYGQGVFVAVSGADYSGKAWTSPDGMAWTKQSALGVHNVCGISYCGGRFFAAGYEGSSLETSLDATNWTSQQWVPNDTQFQPRAVQYANGRFAAVGVHVFQLMGVDDRTACYASSTNGTNWAHPGYWERGLGGLNGIAVLGGSNWVAVGDAGTILTSNDGVSWDSRSPDGIDEDFNAVAAFDGLLVATGDGDRPYTSVEGSAWTRQGMETSVNTLAKRHVTVCNHQFVIAGGSYVSFSANGTAWTRVEIPQGRLTQVTFANGLYVGVGFAGQVLTSTDLLNWTDQSTGITEDLLGVCFGQDRFVAVGSNRSYWSIDGNHWQASSTTLKAYAVAFGNGVFVAPFNDFGDFGIAVSTDGATWQKMNPGYVQAVTYGNGYFVAVSGSTVLTSQDGFTWNSQEPGTSTTLKGVSYNYKPSSSGWTVSEFIAVGERGVVLRSRVPEKRFSIVTFAENGDVRRVPEQEDYAANELVWLTAEPRPGHRFTGWTGALTGTNSPMSLVMDGDKSVTAHFDSLASYAQAVDFWSTNAFTNLVVIQPGGAFSAWMARIPESRVPAGQRQPSSDPDGDGLPNAIEFGMNTDPAAPESWPRIDVSADQIRFTWPRNPDLDTAALRASLCTNLAASQWWTVEQVADAQLTVQTNSTVLSVPISRPQMFLRLGANADAGSSAPSVLTQPQSRTVLAGSSVSFAVVASGTPAPFYQWYRGENPIPGASGSTLDLANVQPADSGSYRVKVANAAGTEWSQVATLTVLAPPAITRQPSNQSVSEGRPATFTITATGSPSPSYHWQFNGLILLANSGPVLILSNVQAVHQGQYSVVVSNVAGSVTSEPALLTVGPPSTAPTIVRQPSSDRTSVGGRISLSAACAGTSPFEYRWQHYGQDIGDRTITFGTNLSLTIPYIQPHQAGPYTVVVANEAGSVTSQVAQISVSIPTVILVQPQSQGVHEAASFTLGVVAQGTELSYWWRKGGTNLYGCGGGSSRMSGCQSSHLSIWNAQPSDAGEYTVQVYGAVGTVTSAVAVVSVWPTNYQPPVVQQPPQSQTVPAGTNVVFSVSATGSAPLSYQWRFNGAPLPGAVSNTLTLTNVQAVHAGEYSVMVSNALSGTASAPAILVVQPPPAPPSILVPPADQSVVVEDSASFSVLASGAAPLSYQWRKDGVDLPDRTNRVLTIDGVQPSDAGSYSVQVSNAGGSITSSNAMLTVQVPPSIQEQPRSRTNALGSMATFTVAASGTQPITYQWRFNGAILSGQTSPNLVLPDVQPSQEGAYDVVVSNSVGSVISQAAALIVWVPPVITGQPRSQTNGAGSTATFTVAASGTQPMNYQWRWDGVVLPGQISPTLLLSNVQPGHEGAYDVIVANSVGGATSQIATLTVWLPPEILTQPQSRTNAEGSTASFAVAASGTTPLSYQWRFNGSPLAGQMSPTLVLPGVQLGQEGDYDVLVSNAVGSVTSMTAHLTVTQGIGGVTITAQPSSQTVSRLGNAVLHVAASGQGPLTCQWYGGVPDNTNQPVAGANGPMFVSPPLITSTSFWVRVSSTNGAADSHAAEITVVPFAASAGHELKGMGEVLYGKLGDGRMGWEATPKLLQYGVVQVAASGYHSLFITSDGSLWAMGDNASGQLGDGTFTPRSIPVLVTQGVSQVAAGGVHSLFLKTDGTLWAMGGNSSGQLGDGTTLSRSIPVLVTNNVTRMAAGAAHSLFVQTNGTLWAVGGNYSGQLGDGTNVNRTRPVLVASEVSQIAAGGAHSLYVTTDQTLWGMGGNSNGQLGDGTNSSRHLPISITNEVTQVKAGDAHTLFLRSDGTLWAMGYNATGQLGDGSTSTRRNPVLVTTNVVEIQAGLNDSLFFRADGSLWGMGNDYYGQLGLGWTSFSRTRPVLLASNGVLRVSTSGRHSLWIKADGSLWGMGYDYYGQLGDGIVNPRTIPFTITNDVVHVAAGANHSFFVKTDGSLWGMGLNDSGQLGDGTYTNRRLPVFITNGVAQAAAGASHSLFLKTDGTLWAAGWNGSGQLGDGTTSGRSRPVFVTNQVAQVAAGDSHSLFVRTDGTLWAMGYNYDGQLGDGTNTSRSSPVLISGDVLQATAGSSHSLFVKTDSTLWAVGKNNNGQLGDGSTVTRYSPVLITNGVLQAAAGGSHSLFVKTDATLLAMGNNYPGQLGDGTTSFRTRPIPVTNGVAQVGAGRNHSLFVKTDGTLWTMGDNAAGQLGDGTLANRTRPVFVTNNVSQSAAGVTHTLILASPITE